MNIWSWWIMWLAYCEWAANRHFLLSLCLWNTPEKIFYIEYAKNLYWIHAMWLSWYCKRNSIYGLQYVLRIWWVRVKVCCFPFNTALQVFHFLFLYPGSDLPSCQIKYLSVVLYLFVRGDLFEEKCQEFCNISCLCYGARVSHLFYTLALFLMIAVYAVSAFCSCLALRVSSKKKYEYLIFSVKKGIQWLYHTIEVFFFIG